MIKWFILCTQPTLFCCSLSVTVRLWYIYCFSVYAWSTLILYMHTCNVWTVVFGLCIYFFIMNSMLLWSFLYVAGGSGEKYRQPINARLNYLRIQDWSVALLVLELLTNKNLFLLAAPLLGESQFWFHVTSSQLQVPYHLHVRMK